MAENDSATDLKVGAICHIEIPAADLKKAEAFYTGVFGWKIETAPGMEGYPFWRDSSGSIGGGFDPDMKVSDGGVNLVLAVKNVDEALVKITEAGGTVVKTRTEISGGHGFYGNFLDPNGNRLGVWSKT